MDEPWSIQYYSYRSLEHGPNKIRLLQLLPGPEEDDITCEIMHYTIKPERSFGLYEALSYVWGDVRETQRILVRHIGTTEYQPLEVTLNLHAALKQLRDPDLPRRLWIDAICINQADAQERGSQVQIMSRIYAHAAYVTVWLGEEENGSSMIFDLFRRGLIEGIAYNEIHTQRLKDLLLRPWFGRIWVLQEVAAARSITFMCGESVLTGPVFLHGVQAVIEDVFSRHDPLLQPAFSVMRLMNKTAMTEPPSLFLSNKEFSDGQGASSLSMAPLVELLERFHTHAATDRRDKIYALLGLSYDHEQFPSLKADYSKSWAALLHDVVTNVLGSTVSIYTWNEREDSVITGSGCPLGILSGDTHEFRSPHFEGIRSFRVQWKVKLSSIGYYDNVREGDILCLMDGAQYPSILRKFKDHFVVVKLALTPPPSIEISWILSQNGIRVLGWKEFSLFVKPLKRQFVLIWDWSTDEKYRHERHKTMLKDVATTANIPTEGVSCLFNLARILEDVEDTVGLRLLLREFSSLQLPEWLDRYIAMLTYVCDDWDTYRQLKVYISQLRWSFWSLTNQDAVDPVTPFWIAKGILGLDLFDILSLTNQTRKIEDRNAGTAKRQVWQFGEQAILPVLDALDPEFDQLDKSCPRTTQENASSAALVRRYITDLIFTKEQNKEIHPKGVLDMLDKDQRLFESAKLSFTMLSEISGMKAEVTSYILSRLRPPQSQPNWELMTFLLEESHADTKSAIAIFQEARLWSLRGTSQLYTTCDRFLIPSATSLCKYVAETDLCNALVEQWESEPTEKASVLEFLCETFTLPFKDMIEQASGHQIGSLDYLRSRTARIDLARKCLLGAIHLVAPWVEIQPNDVDAASHENDITILMGSLDLLWHSKPTQRIIS